MSSNPLSDAELAEVRELLEVAKIKKLRLRLAHLIDSRDFDAAARLWTADAVSDFGPLGTWRGPEEIRRNWKAHYKDALPYSGLHCSTNMWVEITGPATAISRSYLHSVFNDADARTSPSGLFAINDYDYAKVDGSWKVSGSRLH